MDKDPWSYLGDGLKQSTDPAIQGTVGSAYIFLMTVGTLGGLVTLLIVGVKIATAPPAKREKSSAGWWTMTSVRKS